MYIIHKVFIYRVAPSKKCSNQTCMHSAIADTIEICNCGMEDGMEILISKVKSHLETPFSRFAFTSNADDQGRSGLAD